MILYIGNPKDSTKKLLELISEFSKVRGCKINLQKVVAFVYTKNELSERENKKTISQLYQKIPKNKFNQGCKRPVLGKLQDTEENN